jgi:hypothetical protein
MGEAPCTSWERPEQPAMATQAQRLSSSAQEDRGRSPTVRLRRRWVSTPILANLQHIRTVVQFSAVRSLDTPPPPDTAWWGGSRLTGKSAGAPFSVSSVRKHLLRQRCDRAVSSNQRLKSLGDKRWRRPLSQRRRAEGGPRHPSAMLWMPQVHPRCRAARVFNMRLAAIIRTRMSSD